MRLLAGPGNQWVSPSAPRPLPSATRQRPGLTGSGCSRSHSRAVLHPSCHRTATWPLNALVAVREFHRQLSALRKLSHMVSRTGRRKAAQRVCEVLRARCASHSQACLARTLLQRPRVAIIAVTARFFFGRNQKVARQVASGCGEWTLQFCAAAGQHHAASWHKTGRILS